MEIMENTYKITGGVYLVLNPAIDEDMLHAKLRSALLGGIQVVQIWNNWQLNADKPAMIEKIANICKPYSIPVLINADWALLRDVPMLDGIHFDDIPASLSTIRTAVNRSFLTGEPVQEIFKQWPGPRITSWIMFPSVPCFRHPLQIVAIS
jgi:thiamine-phosphate pyrophosphorylase